MLGMQWQQVKQGTADSLSPPMPPSSSWENPDEIGTDCDHAVLSLNNNITKSHRKRRVCCPKDENKFKALLGFSPQAAKVRDIDQSRRLAAQIKKTSDLKNNCPSQRWLCRNFCKNSAKRMCCGSKIVK